MVMICKYDVGEHVFQVCLNDWRKQTFGVSSEAYRVNAVLYHGPDVPITYIIAESSAREDDLFSNKEEALREADRRSAVPARPQPLDDRPAAKPRPQGGQP